MQIPAFSLFQSSYRRLRRELLSPALREAVRGDTESLVSTKPDRGRFQRGAL